MKIVAVDRNQDGEAAFYKLDDGRTISRRQAVELAQLGQIENVIVGQTGDGKDYLRSKPDDRADNNLDNLPEFNAVPDPDGYDNVKERRRRVNHPGRAGADSGFKG
jgi:hypothetical protein